MSSKLIQKYLGVSSTVTSAIRLGSKGAKPHLFKILEKNLILKNCIKLRNKNTQRMFKEFISPQILLLNNKKNKALGNKLKLRS